MGLLMAVPTPRATAAPSTHHGGATAPKAQPVQYEHVETQVFTVPGLGSVAVGMPGKRKVMVQTRPEGGRWSSPELLYRAPGIKCDYIEGSDDGGAVALTLFCDTDLDPQRMTKLNQAFVTHDLETWSSTELGKVWFQPPAVSPNGQHAAWLVRRPGADVVRWSAGAGFSTGLSTFPHGRSGARAVLIDDAQTVSLLGPADSADETSRYCPMTARDLAVDGSEDAYAVGTVGRACFDAEVFVDDAYSVGGYYPREQSFVIAREPGQRWVVRTRAPELDPGLVRYRGGPGKVIPTLFSDDTDGALVALGSPDRKHVTAQVYDVESASWGPAVTVYEHGYPGCSMWDYDDAHDDGNVESPRLHAQTLVCHRRQRPDGTYPPIYPPQADQRGALRLLLTSLDGLTWTSTRVDGRPIGLSPEADLMAVSGPRSTTVVSPGGTVRLPVTALGRCDFVYPIGPDSVLRLHGGKKARWPTKLQKSEDGGAWRTIQVVDMPDRGSCDAVFAWQYYRPTRFILGRGYLEAPSGKRKVVVTVQPGGPGGWRAVVKPFTTFF